MRLRAGVVWNCARYGGGRLRCRRIQTSDRARRRDGDDFVIKPQVSGFDASNLPVLLPKLGVQRLVVTGVAADICVLLTAADAPMRGYELWTPADAVASRCAEHRDWPCRAWSPKYGR